MRTVATDILDTIDGALRDYETSWDAMRWAPCSVFPRLSAAQMAVARRLAADTGIDGYATVLLVDGEPGCDSPWHDLVRAAAAREHPLRYENLTITITIDAEPFNRAFCRLLEVFGQFAARATRQFDGLLAALDGKRTCQYHRRPLAVDGHEYHRRQLARQRRRRR